MSILDRLLGNPEYVVIDHRAYDLAIRNLRKNNYNTAFVRRCFGFMYENGTIISMDKFREQQREEEERKQRLAEWQEREREWQERERMVRPVSLRRLKKMCKYFCKLGKEVYVRYEYNNSMGHHEVRECRGLLTGWEVRDHAIGGQKEFTIELHFDGGAHVFQQSFHYTAEFTGLGKIRECNSGPYNYFTMRWVQEGR